MLPPNVWLVMTSEVSSRWQEKKDTYKGVNKDLWLMVCVYTRLWLLDAYVKPMNRSLSSAEQCHPRSKIMMRTGCVIIFCCDVEYLIADPHAVQAWPTMLDDFVSWKKRQIDANNGATSFNDWWSNPYFLLVDIFQYLYAICRALYHGSRTHPHPCIMISCFHRCAIQTLIVLFICYLRLICTSVCHGNDNYTSIAPVIWRCYIRSWHTKR